MKILISGGAGFVASHIIDLLLKTRNNNILAIDNFSTGKFSNIAPFTEKHGDRFNICEGDITDLPFTIRTFNSFKPEYVIHLAAQPAISTSIMNPVFDNEVNVVGTLNIINASCNVEAKKIIFSSTSAVYKDINGKLNESSQTLPDSPYGISKLAAENYLRLDGKATILRFGNVYGENQVPIGENQLIPRIIRHFKYGDEFYINGDGNQKRDFVYAGDVAQAVVNALYCPPGLFNIASGNSLSVNDICRIMEDLYDIRGYKWDHNSIEDPRKVVKINISKARSELSWKPYTPIREGIKKTMDWWEEK